MTPLILLDSFLIKTYGLLGWADYILFSDSLLTCFSEVWGVLSRCLLKLEEKNWHGNSTLARLYWDKGDAMKAGPFIGHTLQLKPDFAEAHLLAGNILLRLNQHQRAQVEYEEYLRLAPKGEYAAEARDLLQKLRGRQ
jgi:tetratricopeptide (TPR) repeat protein